MKLNHPNFIHYMSELQIKDRFYKKRTPTFVDRYVFHVAAVSVACLLLKFFGEYLVEAWVK